MATIASEGAPLLAAPITGRSARQVSLEKMAHEYPVPPEWARGPLHDRQRRVTDKSVLLLFALCVMMLIGVSFWALKKSTEKSFIRPRDSSGNICGQGKAKNYPFLYLQSFTAPYNSVCVKTCPSFNYAHLLAKTDAGRKAALSKPMRFAEFSRKHAGRSYTTAEVLTQGEAFEYPRHWANGKFADEQWSKYLQGLTVDCLPNAQFSTCRHAPGFDIYDSYAAVRKVCVPLSPKAALLYNKVTARYDLGLAEDLRLALPLITRTVVFTVALGIALLLVAIYLPRYATLLTSALAIAAFLGTAAAIFHSLFLHGPLNDTLNPLRVKYLQFWLDRKLQSLLMIACSLFGALLFALRALKLRPFIATPSHMIRLTARQTLRTPLLIGLTIATLLTQVLVLLGGLHILAKLCTAGKEPAYATGAPFAVPKSSLLHKALIFLYSLGVVWVIATLSALNDFCTEAVSVDYYFNAAIDPLHVLCHTLGHHLGSLALLAALKPVVRLREVLISISAVLPPALRRKRDQSGAVKVYDQFIGGVCPRSLICVYMGSRGFCNAARILHAREKLFDAVIGPLLRAGDLLAGSARVAATLLTGLAAYLLYKGSIAYQQNMNSLCVVWMSACIAGYYIGTQLIDTCCRTLDATYGCYLLQLELNRQGYNFALGPREMQEALAELGMAAKGPYRPLT